MDAALATATRAWIGQHGPANVVGIMGGHAEPRGSRAYRLAAIGPPPGRGWPAVGHRRRPRGDGSRQPGRVHGHPAGVRPGRRDGSPDAPRPTSPTTTGTPPPRSPSGNLPARSADPDHDQLTYGGLAIPTWLYGHEPANLFAAGIAKYFSNAIREDTILRLARGGVVFAPGRAGTVQEIFQAATKAYYLADGPSGPMVFLDATFWTTTIPIRSLLAPLLAGSPHGDLSELIHVTDDVSEAVARLGSA